MRLKKRDPITSEILLLDGITRAGKFFLGKVISHFHRTEFFEYAPILEHIPILWETKVLSKEDTIAFLQLNADMLVYDLAIGRSVNTRFDDHSSIRHYTERARYTRRAKSPDGVKAMEKFLKEKRIPLFLVHETLPLLPIFFEAFSKLKVINIQRHPVDLVHSWHRRSWGTKFFEPDPLSFIPVFAAKKISRPWFALSWLGVKQMKPVDRVIKSILQVQALEHEAYGALSAPQKKRVHILSYERLIESPDSVINKVSRFLGCAPLASMRSVLKREGCYRPISLGERHRKFQGIAKIASPFWIRRLSEQSLRYEKNWAIKAAQ